jgi:hypothetical protein
MSSCNLFKYLDLLRLPVYFDSNGGRPMKAIAAVSSEKNRDFMSMVVETALQRDYSHIIWIVDDIVYHAVEVGVTSCPLAEFMVDHDLVKQKEVELFCDKETFLAHFNFYKGIAYSRTQVLGYVPIVGRLWKNGRKYAWCSEYFCWVINDLGRRWEFADGDIITPTVFEKI